MPQNLRTTFSFQTRNTPRRTLVRAQTYAGDLSLEGLLISMQHYLARAKADLLQPRMQVIDRILREAALLR